MKVRSKKIVILLISIVTIAILFTVSFQNTYSRYILTKNFELNLPSLPFYFDANVTEDKVNCEGNNATITLNILNYEGELYNAFTTNFEVTIEENSKLKLDTISDNIEGLQKITKPLKITLTTIDGQALQTEETITIIVKSTEPYSKEIRIPVTILASGKRELTKEELKKIAEDNLADGFEGMTAYDVYGDEIENAENLWIYEKRQSDNSWELNTDDRYYNKQPAYIGEIVDGTILGQIPAYIIDEYNGTVHEGPVTSLKGIFYGLTNLTHLNDEVRIPQFIEKMEFCFYGSGLQEIPKGFLKIPDSVQTAEGLFSYSQIKSVPEGFTLGANVSNVIDLFRGTPIETIGESFVLGDQITECDSLFYDCTQLKSLPDNFQLPVNVEDFSDVFRGCESLTSVSSILTLPNGAKSIDSLFRGCKSLQSLPNSFAIPESVNNMRYTFYHCYLLTTLPEGVVIPQGVTNLEYTFSDCSSLQSLPENISIPSSVTTMNHTFYQCTSLTSLPKNFTIAEGVTNMEATFSGCTELREMPTDLVIPKSVETIEDMIRECVNLTGHITLLGIPSTSYYKAFYNTARYSSSAFIIYYPQEIDAEMQAIVQAITSADEIHHGQIEFVPKDI